MAALAYHVIPNEAENRVFRQNRVFGHTCKYEQPRLTKYWNYSDFVQILYIVISDTLIASVFFLFLTQILSELQENKRKMIESQKKVHRRFSVNDIYFFWLPPSVIFCHFFSSTPILLRKKTAPENAGAPFAPSVCIPDRLQDIIRNEFHCGFYFIALFKPQDF